MALSPGVRVGPYEIVAQIGAGGMGEVYKATDTNLKRGVAIKVLPEAVTADAERLARFQREAEVLAALSHQNIAAIYGLERTETTSAIAMELVDGPTLADRIAQGAIPVTTPWRSSFATSVRPTPNCCPEPRTRSICSGRPTAVHWRSRQNAR